MANKAKRLMDPYVPFREGFLSKNITVGVDSDGGFVKYNEEPYARYQYYGINMIGKKTKRQRTPYGEGKEVTSKKLNYSKARHPFATSYWDKAMKTARMDDLTKATQNYIRRYV